MWSVSFVQWIYPGCSTGSNQIRMLAKCYHSKIRSFSLFLLRVTNFLCSKMFVVVVFVQWFLLIRSMKQFGYHAVHILFASFINKFMVCRFPSIFRALFGFVYSIHGPWLVAHSPCN